MSSVSAALICWRMRFSAANTSATVLHSRSTLQVTHRVERFVRHPHCHNPNQHGSGGHVVPYLIQSNTAAGTWPGFNADGR